MVGLSFSSNSSRSMRSASAVASSAAKQGWPTTRAAPMAAAGAIRRIIMAAGGKMEHTKARRSFPPVDPESGASSGLLAEMGKRLPQRSAGDPKQTLERPVQRQDQKDRTRHREPRPEKGADWRGVGGRQESEAHEDDGEPEHQHHQEWHGYRATPPRVEQPACLREVELILNAWAWRER